MVWRTFFYDFPENVLAIPEGLCGAVPPPIAEKIKQNFIISSCSLGSAT